VYIETTMNASQEFAAHLASSTKTEWILPVGGLRFALVRLAPPPGCYYNPRKPIEEIPGWALFVVADDGSQKLIHTITGFCWNIDPERGPRLGSMAQHALKQMLEFAAVYVEAWQRLSVMLDFELATESGGTSKVRKMREAGALALRFHKLEVHRESFGLVAGGVVLIVSRRVIAQQQHEWIELTYREGDEAAHGAYNLVYTGTITSISPKTITIEDRHGDKTRRLKHSEFLWRNDRPIHEAHKRNSEWSD
jgi:hypothetical protein